MQKATEGGGKSAVPLSAYIEQIESLDKLFTTEGKPQMLTIVGEQLYWLQGTKQELYTLKISDLLSSSSSSLSCLPQKVIASTGDEKKQKTFDEFRPSSKEEELLRERQRKRVTGISNYHIRSTDKAVFFISGMDLFYYHPSNTLFPVKVFDYINEQTRQRYFAAVEKKPFLNIRHFKRKEAAKSVVEESTPTPTFFSFVYDGNLYIATIIDKTTREMRVAKENDIAQETLLDVHIERVTSFGDALHECGTADYIMQEEFDRYTGHYATGRYILFSYTDTSMLRTISLLDGSSESGVEDMKYCRVGDNNARTLLVVYEQENKCFRVVPHQAINKVAPWAEYIPRFGFKDDNTIYFSLLSRTQEQHCVLSCRVDMLPEVDTNILATYFSMEAEKTKTHTTAVLETNIQFTMEWEEHIPWAWVDITSGPPILFGRTYDILLAHAKDTETAHRHIHIRKRGAGAGGWWQLTKGAWNVRPGTIELLKDKVIFIANAHNRLGNAIFSVSLAAVVDKTSTPQLTQLSPSDEHVYSYIIKNDKLCYVASTRKTPPQFYVTTTHDITKRFLIRTEAQCDEAKPNKPLSVLTNHKELVIPEIITIISRRGVPLSGRLYISPSAVKGKPAPLFMYIYGGPHAQLVYENDYDAVCKPFFQLLVSQGISVLVADGQMSNANGLRDLCICKNNMGSFETSDYVDFVKHMTTSLDLPYGFIADPSRISICGWSYGGYATLLAMSQASDVFKIGFAGAPVGDWTLYDTGYTERYMGELYADTSKVSGEKKCINKAYITSAIKNFVSGFPDELNRVFIAHGILDENVHFIHTCAVIDAMVDAGKPFVILTYPGERHGLRKKKISGYHHFAMITKTLVEML